MPRRARLALIGAAGCVILLALTWYLAHYVGVFKRADVSILSGFLQLDRPGLDRWTNRIASLCDPQRYVFLAVIPIVMALVRGFSTTLYIEHLWITLSETLLASIQPVWLSGRPGRRTLSHCCPPAFLVATIGSTVRSPVIGRTSLTSPAEAEPDRGVTNASVSWLRTASC